MEAIVWGFRTLDSFVIASPILFSLVLCLLVLQSDFFSLTVRLLWRAIRGQGDRFAPRKERPSAVIVIPSLLRNEEDLNAFTTTLESCATNGYPGELVIIASVDGRTEHPKLYAALEAFIEARRDPENVSMYLTGT